jgi:actin-related protein 8
VIPDIFVKHHLRHIVQMLLAKIKFKSLFIHTESVMATFAMAMSSACVVDIGATKINVCCIEDGSLLSKSIVRRHYGGDDLNQMLYRLINRNKGLHYFPRFSLQPDYHYHKIIIEYIKENFTLTEMDIGEVVKTCQIKVKDKLNTRHRKVQ